MKKLILLMALTSVMVTGCGHRDQTPQTSPKPSETVMVEVAPNTKVIGAQREGGILWYLTRDMLPDEKPARLTLHRVDGIYEGINGKIVLRESRSPSTPVSSPTSTIEAKKAQS